MFAKLKRYFTLNSATVNYNSFVFECTGKHPLKTGKNMMTLNLLSFKPRFCDLWFLSSNHFKDFGFWSPLGGWLPRQIGWQLPKFNFMVGLGHLSGYKNIFF